MGERFQNFTNRLFDPGPLSEQNVSQTRQLGDLMMLQSSRPRAIQHPAQGFAQLAEAMNAQIFRQRASRGEGALKAQQNKALGDFMAQLNLNPQQSSILEGVQDSNPELFNELLGQATSQLFPEPPDELEPPATRTVNRDDLTVTEQFNSETGKYEEIATAPRFKETSSTSQVVTPILQKLARGEQLTPGEQRVLDFASRADALDQMMNRILSGQSGNPGGGNADIPEGPTATGPNGEKLVLRNGQWVQQ